jgi:hypothetical protein
MAKFLRTWVFFKSIRTPRTAPFGPCSTSWPSLSPRSSEGALPAMLWGQNSSQETPNTTPRDGLLPRSAVRLPSRLRFFSTQKYNGTNTRRTQTAGGGPIKTKSTHTRGKTASETDRAHTRGNRGGARVWCAIMAPAIACTRHEDGQPPGP